MTEISGQRSEVSSQKSGFSRGLTLSALHFALSLLCALLYALCLPVSAQQSTKIPRISILISASPSNATRRIQAFQQGLRELGYVEGKNIIIEYRYAEGKLELLAKLTEELIRLKPDVIVTDTSRATQAAKNATKTIPVVYRGSLLQLSKRVAQDVLLDRSTKDTPRFEISTSSPSV